MTSNSISQAWPEKWHNLIQQLEIIETDVELTNRIDHLVISLNSPKILAFVNAHAFNQVVVQNDFYQALTQADVLYRDGSGVAKMLNALQRPPGLNLNGTDLIPQIIQSTPAKRIALYGTQDPYLSQAAAKIQTSLNPQASITSLNGFLDFDDYLSHAKQNQPGLIILAMGMPKQERLAVELKRQLSHPCLIVCGGAILDFMGGKVTRAPKWMQDSGIEWVYRLFKEPRRLFKRYVIGNPLFLYRVRKLKNSIQSASLNG